MGIAGEFVEKQTSELQPQQCRLGAGLRNMRFKSWLRLGVGWGGARQVMVCGWGPGI